MESKITHPELVTALAKPGADIVATLTPEDAHALHMAVGISGESGELLDAIKKAAIYRKPIDRANVIEELGDLEFYMEGLRQGLGITREETIDANIAKLSKRYSSGSYSDKHAQERADKNPAAERNFIGQHQPQE
ncbi:MAG: nucleoside triphosphate pyrophosphohydrolase family protein [Halothiobacillaceae bacterium]